MSISIITKIHELEMMCDKKELPIYEEALSLIRY